MASFDPDGGALVASSSTSIRHGSWKTYLEENGHVVHRHAEICAEKGATVRAGMALDSKKVATLPHKAPLSVVREARTSTGILRLRVKTRPGSFCPQAVDGWVSETTAKGTRLVETTDPHPPEDAARPGGFNGPTGADAFADFVIKTVMAPADLCGGSGALDVAGGNGPLSTALAKRGVRCNLVDPAAPEEMRVAVRDDIKKSHGPLFRIYKRHFNVDDPEPPADRAIAAAGDAGDDEGAREEELRRERISRRELGLEYCAAVGTCSALLGYRPCQATQNIVDRAIRKRKPFAILPCCAYAVDGQSVKGIHDMCDKLQQKHESIKRTVCDGSLVLYSTFGREPPGSVL